MERGEHHKLSMMAAAKGRFFLFFL